MSALDKRVLLKALIERLTQEFERVKAQALDAAEGATHEDNRAEGDKDMRSTEASYIARGHAQRTAQLEQSIARLSHLDLPNIDEADEVKVTALVEVGHAKQRLTYFLVPVGGGERLTVSDTTVQTLTPSSPLGGALMGLSVGDEAEVESPQGVRVYEILSVS
jgi:transcription elongation GreA/GreB family factor